MKSAQDDGDDATFVEKARLFLKKHGDHPERHKVRAELASALVAKTLTTPETPEADEARALLLKVEQEAPAEEERYRAALFRLKFSPKDDPAVSARAMIERFKKEAQIREVLIWAVAETTRLGRTRDAIAFSRLFLEYFPQDADASKYKRIVQRSALKGQPAPFTDDERAQIGAALKAKVVLLDFWASWCRPCVAELPELKKLHEKYGSRGLSIVAIGVDKNLEDHQKFLQQHAMPWTVIHAPGDPVMDRFGVDALPTHLLLDAAGRTVATELSIEELPAAIETQLSE